MLLSTDINETYGHKRSGKFEGSPLLLKNRDRKIVSENSLTFQWSAILGKKFTQVTYFRLL